MKPKTKKIVDMVATAIPVILISLSAVLKFVASPEVVKTLTNAGVAQYIPILGMMELGFAILFLFPATMRIGFILLSCYFAGAIATELSHNGALPGAIFTLVLVWVSAFIRDKTIFLPKSGDRKMSLQ